MRYIINGKTCDWELVCGLEIHCQITSNSKLFSRASTTVNGTANNQVSFVDVAMPGMLPTLNKECVKQTIKTGLGLNAKINEYSEFARKNYFYADLPQGYQISQYDKPIVGEGNVEVDLEDGSIANIGIERIHIEQDTGKSSHDMHPMKSFVDYNRAGVALMEIVTKPDVKTPEQAGAFLRKLRSIVRYLGTCDGNMDEGSMRCDVNVSVRPVGEEGFRDRCEMKNVNSVKFVMDAIIAEAKRHVEVYENGGTISQETRKYNHHTNETTSLRSKENAHDYRYFPEPDLPPLVLTDEIMEEARSEMIELPDVKKKRFVSDFGLSEYDASVIVVDKDIADYFEVVAKIGKDAKKAASWLTSELFGVLKVQGKKITESPVSATNLGELVSLIVDETISGKIAKDVFEIMIETGNSPAKIVEEKGLKQVTDTSAIEKIVDEVIASSPENVALFKSGKDRVMGWFVGQVMKATQGKANPGMVNKLIKEKLNS